jgi:CspA family cold shock protein
MPRGTVKWFNSQKGYGFIQPQSGGKDVFVHISAVEKAGLPGLNEGQVVEYEENSNRGKTSAENLKVSAEVYSSGRSALRLHPGQRLARRCSFQFGRASAMIPQRVHTIRGRRVHSTTLSGHDRRSAPPDDGSFNRTRRAIE